MILSALLGGPRKALVLNTTIILLSLTVGLQALLYSLADHIAISSLAISCALKAAIRSPNQLPTSLTTCLHSFIRYLLQKLTILLAQAQEVETTS